MMPRFIDNLDAVVKAIGPQQVGVVWGLATTNWTSESERDQFLSELNEPRG